MAIEIRRVSSKKELKKFIRFNYELYKKKYSVPIYEGMLDFDPKRILLLRCEAEYFLAYKTIN